MSVAARIRTACLASLATLAFTSLAGLGQPAAAQAGIGFVDRSMPPARLFQAPQPDGMECPYVVPGEGRICERDLDRLDGRLSSAIAHPDFPSDATLERAINYFNLMVLTMDEDDLRQPPIGFALARDILPRTLAMLGTRVASAAPTTAATSRATPADPRPLRPALLPGGTLLHQPASQPWTVPGMSAATPIGFGADWGTVWAGATYEPRIRYGRIDDGVAAVGIGLGDAERWVGLQVGVNSFSTVRGGLGNRIGVDLHLHRALDDLTGVAVGWEGVGGRDAQLGGNGSSLYVVGSRWLPLRSDPEAPLGLAMVSLGVGSGRFQLEDDFLANESGVGVFGSVGLRILPPISVIAEWTGQDLMIAASITPIKGQLVAFTAGFTELTGTAGDRPRFALGGSVGWAFR